MSVPTTYEEFLVWVLPGPRPQTASSGSSSAPYSARHSPVSLDDYLVQSSPYGGDPAADLIKTLRAYLQERDLLTRQLPAFAVALLGRLVGRWTKFVIRVETKALDELCYMIEIVRDILEDLDAPGLQYCAPPESYSQEGDRTLDQNGRCVAIEAKKPQDVTSPDMMRSLDAAELDYWPAKREENGRAALAKLALHMGRPLPYTDAKAEWAVLFSLLQCRIIRRVDIASVGDSSPHPVLLVSALYSCFAGEPCSVPIIAVLVALLLPGISCPLPPLPAKVTVKAEAPPAQNLTAVESSALDLESPSGAEGNDDADGMHYPSMAFCRAPAGLTYESDYNSKWDLSSPPGGSNTPPFAPVIVADPSRKEHAPPVVLLRTRLHDGPDATTWLAALSGRKVIVKEYHRGRSTVLKELEAMRTVRARCGNIVPEAYGVFGFADWDGGYLVQAWCGTALQDFDSLSGSDKETLMAMFKTLHSQGIEHGDVEPRNVVRDPTGKLTIIDLGMANVEHRCSDSCEELAALASRL